MWEKINLPDLGKIKELLIEKGIYESLTALLDTPYTKGIVMSQLGDLMGNFRKNYEVVAERIKLEDVDGAKMVKIMLYIEDPEKKEELRRRLLNTVEKVREYDIAKAFLKEFEIKKIQCEVKDEWVELRVLANEKFAELVKKMGGDMVEEG